MSDCKRGIAKLQNKTQTDQLKTIRAVVQLGCLAFLLLIGSPLYYWYLLVFSRSLNHLGLRSWRPDCCRTRPQGFHMIKRAAPSGFNYAPDAAILVLPKAGLRIVRDTHGPGLTETWGNWRSKIHQSSAKCRSAPSCVKRS
jgi:hypothetical protein